MRQRPILLPAALAVVLLFGNSPLLALPIVYMGNSKGIESFDPLDSNSTARTNVWPTTSPHSAVPDDLAIDSVGRKLYWAETGKIRRGNIDGTGSIQDIVTGLSFPKGLELDVAAGKVYWFDVSSLKRANMDGSGSVETLFTITGGLRDLNLDIAAGKVYWWGSNAIRRANLDGTSPEVVWSAVADFLAIDPTGGKIYWSNLFDDKIRRGNLDGTGSIEEITTTINGPSHLALDLANGKLYVQDTSAAFAPNVHRYRRFNLDGTGPELLRDYATILTAQAGGIALGPSVVPEPSTMVCLSLGFVALAALKPQRRRRSPTT